VSREGFTQGQGAKSHGPHYKIAGIADLAYIAKQYGAITIAPSDKVNEDCGCKCNVSVSIAHATGNIELVNCSVADIESIASKINVAAICNKANMKAGIY
jgi:hypothetical protein